jgi:hypothetical protein
MCALHTVAKTSSFQGKNTCNNFHIENNDTFGNMSVKIIVIKLHLQRAEKAPHTLIISRIAPGTSELSFVAI